MEIQRSTPASASWPVTQPLPMGDQSPASMEPITEYLPAFRADIDISHFQEWRKNYRAWRMGKGQGAIGELNHSGQDRLRNDELDRPDFMSYPLPARQNEDSQGARSFSNDSGQTLDPLRDDDPYPSEKIFKFRSLSAYFAGIHTLVGSLLFAFNSAVMFSFIDIKDSIVTTWPNFFGGCCFIAGNYSFYFQLINLPTDVNEPVRKFTPRWREVVAKSKVSSRLGCLSYFFGAIFFQVGVTLEMSPHLKYVFEESASQAYIFKVVPNTIGCILFVIGSSCELVHNRMLPSRRCRHHSHEGTPATPKEVVWWAAVFNTFGSILFLAGSVPPLLAIKDKPGEAVVADFINMMYFIGSILFAISGVALVIMWRSDDFGLTLLKHLNYAKLFTRANQPNSPTAGGAQTLTSMSWRGVSSIFVLCWLQSVCLLNAIVMDDYEQMIAKRRSFYHFLRFARNVLLIGVIFLMLILNSIFYRLPQRQPIRFIMLGFRWLFPAWAMVETCTLIEEVLSDTSFISKNMTKAHGHMPWDFTDDFFPAPATS